jgi:hypothetical protein
VLNKKVLFHFAVTFCKLTCKHLLCFSVSHSFSRCFFYPSTQSPFWGMWSSEFLIPYVRSSDRCSRRFRSSSCLFLTNLTLKMKSLRSLQTSVIIYQSSRRNILRDFYIQFPINTARILFVVCRNIPVWTQRVWYWSMLKRVQFRIVTWGKVWGVVT